LYCKKIAIKRKKVPIVFKDPQASIGSTSQAYEERGSLMAKPEVQVCKEEALKHKMRQI
jgi:hypothetical protein